MPDDGNVFDVFIFFADLIDQLVCITGGLQVFSGNEPVLFNVKPVCQDFRRLHRPHCRAAQDQV